MSAVAILAIPAAPTLSLRGLAEGELPGIVVLLVSTSCTTGDRTRYERTDRVAIPRPHTPILTLGGLVRMHDAAVIGLRGLVGLAHEARRDGAQDGLRRQHVAGLTYPVRAVQVVALGREFDIRCRVTKNINCLAYEIPARIHTHDGLSRWTKRANGV